MADLTRRKFLTGAPAVAAVAVVGVAAALVEPTSFPVITSDDNAERMYKYWRAAQTEHIALQPKPPWYFWIDKDGIVYRAEGHPPLNWQPI